MLKSVLSAILGIAVVSAATPSLADGRTTEVKFAPGATYATVKDTLRGYDTNTYILGANAGQTLSIHFTPKNRFCYYNVLGPSGGEAFNGATQMGDYSGRLKENGNHTVMVYLMRNEARRDGKCDFAIRFEINN